MMSVSVQPLVACLVIAELQGDHAAQYRKNAVRINDIDIDLLGGENGLQRLILNVERLV